MKILTKQMMVGFTALTIGFSGVAIQPPVAVEASARVVYETTENLNLRTGGSIKHKQLMTIPKGKSVTYIGKSGSWYKVKYGNKTGYVSSKYLKKPGSKPAITKVSNPAKTVYTTTANLNLRKGASTKHQRVLTIPKGKSVTYAGKSGSWYKVSYNGKTGYVSANYLKKGSPKASTPKPSVTKVSSKAGYKKIVTDVEVTAYTFNSGANRTASGKKLQVGDVSAPREIPFGSIVDIPGIEKQLGVNELKVYDRGGAIKRLSSNKIRIDVAFPNRTEALKFGRKTYKNVTVYVRE